MKQRAALILSAGITSFMLVIGGGTAALLTNTTTADATTNEATAFQTVSTATLTDAGLTAAQREAQYIQLINQANAQISQANAEIAQLQAQLQQAQAPATTPTYAVSVEQAKSIALNIVPGATVVRVPDLVNYQGAVAYEVVLDKGTLYIDATSGQVIANGALTVNSNRRQRENNAFGGDD